MTLEPQQRLCMRAADGGLTPAEAEVLRAEGVDVEAWAALPGLVREALRPEGEVELVEAVLSATGLSDDTPMVGPHLRDEHELPELTDDVLASLELAQGRVDIGAAVRAEAGPVPQLARGVLDEIGLDDSDLSAPLRDEVAAALAHEDGEVGLRDVLDATGLADPSLEVGVLLREALSVDESVDLSDEVMARIGLESVDAGPLLAETLAEAAGPPPTLWDGLASELGLGEADEVAPSETAPVPLQVVPSAQTRPGTSVRRWERGAFIGAGLAAAAALLLFVTQTDSTDAPELAALELSAVNQVEFEDIYSEAMVQVIDVGDDAPPIIFISELIDDDLFEDEEGRL